MEDVKNKKDRTTEMADRRKQIEAIYSGNDEELRRVFDKGKGAAYGQNFTQDSLEELIAKVGSESFD